MAILAAFAERQEGIGWIKIRPVQKLMEEMFAEGADDFVELHTAVAIALQDFRADPDVRIVVITGEVDGEFYAVPRAERFLDGTDHADRVNPIRRGTAGGRSFINPNEWLQRGTKLTKLPPYAIETLLLMEKPVIARVNGDAIGFGQSLLWACDFIVAREDAVISDAHMSLGQVVDHEGNRRGMPWAVTPGDGLMSFWPLFLPHTKAKEFMMLSRTLTAKDLAALNIINYAVPAELLDATLESLLKELLAKPQYALERVKRVANKHLIQQWNLVQDLGWSYEQWDFTNHAMEGHMEPGWTPDQSTD
jgi:enoyl-CoA hydratase/carnithine racemase